jgi:predicted NBD/HSP70 family sugar kinase
VTFDMYTRRSRADQRTVRRANLGVVLRHVATYGPRSRARIAAETGLTRGTVSSLVTELMELRLLRETGEGSRGRPGRPSQTLALDDVVAAVGLEVNVDYVAAVVEDLSGTVRFERRSYGDNRGSDPDEVLDRLAELAAEALRHVELDGLVPAGIALALPGLVERSTGVLLIAPNLGWRELAAAEQLTARLGGAPVWPENEANLAAVAERMHGSARDLVNFVCVSGEVGVGAGLYVDGELYRGARGFGGEFGHVVVDRNGEHCACGGRGCLETVVGQEAIARRAGTPLPEGRARSLTDELVKRARSGDPAVLGSLHEAGEVLGVALASAVNVMDLEAIVLGGCLAPLAPWLVDGVEDALKEQVLAAAWSPCEVRVSEFGEGAAVRGAAAVTLASVLDNPRRIGELASHPISGVFA